MLPNVAVCPLASFILILVVIINVLDIYLVGFHFAILLTNLLISVFFVWLANKTCDKYQWVSWLITGYFVICIIGAVALILNPSMSKDHREGFSEGAAGATGATAATAGNTDSQKKDEKKTDKESDSN
jgi:O-antigen/teichoic acid export membrane protein